MARVLGHGERVSWLRLARTPRIGALTFHRLLARFGGADAALETAPRLAHGTLKPPPPEAIEGELAALAAMGACALASCATQYPQALAGLDAPPPVICAHGDALWLDKPAIALVGAREASAAGAKLAADLARDLGAAGYVIVSGLARGIDAAAHRAALPTGTIAVLAGGLDKPYPPQNEKLHEAIVARGCVISEAPLGMAPRARDFPRRNHLISGMALAVVVVEAAERSGSLITARAAAEQGREVMAAPGSPLDPRARGANRLIKQGAALIESAEDVIAALEAAPRMIRRAAQPFLFEAAAPAPDRLSDVELGARLLQLLSPTPIHLNDRVNSMRPLARWRRRLQNWNWRDARRAWRAAMRRLPRRLSRPREPCGAAHAGPQAAPRRRWSPAHPSRPPRSSPTIPGPLRQRIRRPRAATETWGRAQPAPASPPAILGWS